MTKGRIMVQSSKTYIYTLGIIASISAINANAVQVNPIKKSSASQSSDWTHEEKDFVIVEDDSLPKVKNTMIVSINDDAQDVQRMYFSFRATDKTTNVYLNTCDRNVYSVYEGHYIIQEAWMFGNKRIEMNTHCQLDANKSTWVRYATPKTTDGLSYVFNEMKTKNEALIVDTYREPFRRVRIPTRGFEEAWDWYKETHTVVHKK